MSADLLSHQPSPKSPPPTPDHCSSENWNVYRTRFLIHAKQLSAPLSFTDPLGRQHSGVAGDYLVQSSDGLLRIAPREIFEDVYVPLQRTTENPAVYPCSESLSS
jgi:hypothetical protein